MDLSCLSFMTIFFYLLLRRINRKYVSKEWSKCWAGTRLCLHEIHFILPFAASKHAFDPQYFCSFGIWGADVFLVFSKAYSVMNTIEITSKINDKTDKKIRDVFEPDLRFPDLKETSFSCSNGSILKGFNRVPINKDNVIGDVIYFRGLLFIKWACLQLIAQLSRGGRVASHNTTDIWLTLLIRGFFPNKKKWKTQTSHREANTITHVFRAEAKSTFRTPAFIFVLSFLTGRIASCCSYF